VTNQTFLEKRDITLEIQIFSHFKKRDITLMCTLRL